MSIGRDTRHRAKADGMPRRTRLNDGSLPGPLTRRMADVLFRGAGQIVDPALVRAHVWPEGAPSTWREQLYHHAARIHYCLGRGTVERVGRGQRLEGWRLRLDRLPTQGDEADGHWVRGRPSRRPLAWTRAEDRVIRDRAGAVPLQTLTVEVNAVGSGHRSLGAVEKRACHLGVSLASIDLCAEDVAALFGIQGERVIRWIGAGMLEATRIEPWPTRQVRSSRLKPHRKWRITEAAVEAFLVAYPWEYTWAAMSPDHRLTLRARAIQRTNPWFSKGEVARRLGISESGVTRLLERGRLTGAVRLLPYYADAGPGAWRIPGAAVDAELERRRMRRRRAS